MSKALLRDSLQNSHPLYRNAYQPAQISGLFDAIAYQKVGQEFFMSKNKRNL